MNARLNAVAAAEQRLIAARVGATSPATAQKFLAAVTRTAQDLAAFPLSGAEYPHSNPNLGEVRVVQVRRLRNYVLLYTVEPTEVVVLHVAHARQDLDALLSRD